MNRVRLFSTNDFEQAIRGPFTETLRVLVDLLEASNPVFHGHSGAIAHQSALIARRIGLAAREVVSTSVAAFLHELGKPQELHVTVALLAARPELRAGAAQLARAPIGLFEMVHLAAGVNVALAQLYEFSTGAAFRVRPRVRPGALFDPLVVDALAAVQSGELLRQRLKNDGRQIIVADPDEAIRVDLLDSLGKLGLEVQPLARLDGVVAAVLSNSADTVVAGLGYGVDELVALALFLRTRPESASVPLLVLGSPTDPTTRGLLQDGDRTEAR